MEILKRVLIIKDGAETVYSDYDNYEVLNNSDSLPTGKFFNQAKNRAGYDYYVYLGKYYNFSSPSSLTRMVEYLNDVSRSFVVGVYSDLLLNDKDISFIQHLPSFDMKLIKGKFAFNTPFCVKKYLLPTFDENIQSLNLWDGFLSLSKQSVLFHIPEPLFKLDNALDTTLVNADLNIINEIYYKTG